MLTRIGQGLNRWRIGLKNVANDYLMVGKDIIKYSKKKPIRFTVLSLATGTSVWLYMTNPNIDSYITEVIGYSNEISQCSSLTRNPTALSYVETIILDHSQQSLMSINCGIFSLIVKRAFYKECFNYREVCPHLKPRGITSFRNRVVDIGIMKKWLLLERNMIDFDINDDSFDNKYNHN
jgi:hypothetical protein